MPTIKPAPAPSRVREEIENALGGKVAATARWLASKIGRSARLVRTELELMAREGKITSRTTRAGDVLYKRIDRLHHRWAGTRLDLGPVGADLSGGRSR